MTDSPPSENGSLQTTRLLDFMVGIQGTIIGIIICIQNKN
jgi:hypothetical protein